MKKLFLLFIPFLIYGCITLANSKDIKLVGSIKSNIYHKTDCRFVRIINPRYLIDFDSPEEAIKKGYRPCLICRPPTKGDK
jgi:methylphosphotriester-DNA--protein-cysteine methyltransferase